MYETNAMTFTIIKPIVNAAKNAWIMFPVANKRATNANDIEMYNP